MATGTTSALSSNGPGAPDHGTSDSAPSEPARPTLQASADHRRSGLRQSLEATSIATALIGAVGGLLAALITGMFTLAGADPHQPEAPPKISLDSWTERPGTGPSSKIYEFSGTVTQVPQGMVVHVIAEAPQPDVEAISPSGRSYEWLVSPRADILQNGQWKVTWTVKNPPESARWRAVLVNPEIQQPTSCSDCMIDIPSYLDDLKTEGVYSQRVLVAARSGQLSKSEK
ncbi:hypothetical protein ACFYXF_28995 [Streptomyces sp. NPDC002680]|uniref:hypothetical protein n=1 Tax=Streptomyces sp. NPDC002680 TaxID=3364659 RepID=UPI0036B4CA4F